MDMNRESLKQRLRNGDTVFGIWCVIPSASAINIIASAGFDFVIIDLEHGPASFETAEEMVRAAQSEGVAAIIRLGQVNEEYILKVLDIGAEGVMAAHVSSHKDAQEAVDFAKYYPEGKRGFSPYTRAGRYSGGNITEHARQQNQRTIMGVLVEGKEGIENLAEISSTPNLDLVYIGAYDLSQALGMPGEVGHPMVKEAMKDAVDTIRSAGISAGGYVAKNADDIRWMVSLGMQFITYLPDCALFHRVCRSAVDEFISATDS